MRIAITGATGLIGSKLTAFLSGRGHQIAVITRQSFYHKPPISTILWDPALDYIQTEKLEGYDAVINLAGANVGEYWSAKNKKKILESRVQSTKLLCETFLRLNAKPKVFISASAIGFYGNHSPQEQLDEDSTSGLGFLADVCRRWEKETNILSQSGIRVIRMRLGVVLSRSGGALAKMWRPFKLGVGGRIGDGRQMMSWVALDEIPYCVDFLIKNEKISGAVNVVSPQAITNAEFTKVLGEVIGRPTLIPVPSPVIRLMFGEMGQDLLLEGAHVIPRRLQENDYQFRFAYLEDALKKVIE